MKIYLSINDFYPHSNTIFTLGVFDGVHTGHCKLIERLNQKALETQSSSVLLSFTPHPKEIISSCNINLKYLTTINEKIRLLELTGLQHFILQPFTKNFSNIKSKNFIRNFLLKQCKMKYLIVGYDNYIGKNRDGSYEELKKLSLIYKFNIERFNCYKINNKVISSSSIRQSLLSGNLFTVNQNLGYPYIISGKIIPGNQLGSKLGFPTANIQVNKKKLLPVKGVYAVRINIHKKQYIGMLNIGTRPTIGGLNIRIEVHLLDFSEIIYDEIIYIFLIYYIRAEQKFNTLTNLKAQLKKDEKIVRNLFLK